MVLTKTPLKKHRTSAMTNLKEDRPISNEHRKSTLIKKTSRMPSSQADKTQNQKNNPKVAKTTNHLKQASKILKSASVTKKITTGGGGGGGVEISKIPVPLSKSSTFKQVTVQKHNKLLKTTTTTTQKKKMVEAQEPNQQQQQQNVSIMSPSMNKMNKADVKIVMSPKGKSSPHLEKFSQSDVTTRLKQLKKHDAENLKRIKNQYFSSVLADIRKTDLETTLRKYASTDKSNGPQDPKELKKKKRKSIKKKPSPKVIHLSPRIVSENNEYDSINSMRKETPSLTTHFLEADSQTSQIPVTAKRHYKLVKTKKSPRAKMLADNGGGGGGKDVKATQLTQHKKKSKTHTLKLNRVQSSDSVPNLPIREIKHNDSFVLSAKKLENSSSMKRAARHKKSPEHLKLKTKRPKSAAHHQTAAAFKSAEPKSDSTKPEQLKSCLKKTWDENDFTAVNTKYEMNFGLVPLIVN